MDIIIFAYYLHPFNIPIENNIPKNPFSVYFFDNPFLPLPPLNSISMIFPSPPPPHTYKHTYM